MPRWDVGETPVAGYKLVDFLGRGGFGEVWLAEAPGGIQCALKIIDLVSPDALKELKALRLMKRLKHPHLVPVTAFWIRDRRGNVLALDELDLNKPTAQLSELLIAMGLGEKSLAKRLEEENPLGTNPDNRKGIPVDELLRYMEGVAKGIDYLNQPDHRLGEGDASIIHCDIKPANLLVVADEAQVCDYGLARALKRDERRVSMAGGTPAYSPPELLGNKPCLGTDQYSLAITYSELRTGSLPFPDDMSLTDIYRIHAEERLDFTAAILTGRERDVLRRATRSRPADRFSNCRKFIDELKAAVFRAQTGTISMSSLDRSAEMPALPKTTIKPQDTSSFSAPPVQADYYEPAPDRYVPPARQATPRGSMLDELREGGHPIPGYTLAHLVGTDSTGQTWQATDSSDRLRVLRVLFQPATKDTTGLTSLNALQTLEHDHVARLYEYAFIATNGEVIDPGLVGRGPTAAGLIVVTEDVVRTLADRLSQCQHQEGRLGIPEEELIRYIRECAFGLDAMREKATSLLHLRLRPEVIGLTRHGSVKLVDAGLSSFVPVGELKAAVTTAAPEVIEGQPSGRSDAYALALTYYKLRTGRLPFHESLDVNRQRDVKKRGEFEWILVTPAEQDVLSKATRANPGERYANVKAFVDALTECFVVRPQPAFRPEPVARSSQDHVVDFNTPPPMGEDILPLQRSDSYSDSPQRRETPRPSKTYETPRKSDKLPPTRQGSLLYGTENLDDVEPPPSVLPAEPVPVAPWERGSSTTHKPLASKVATPRSFIPPPPNTQAPKSKTGLIVAGVVGVVVVGGGIAAAVIGGVGKTETTGSTEVTKGQTSTVETGKPKDDITLAEDDIAALEKKGQFALAVARAEKETPNNGAWVKLRMDATKDRWRKFVEQLPDEKVELALAEYSGRFGKDEWLTPRRQAMVEKKLVVPNVKGLSLKDGLAKLASTTKDLEALKTDVTPEAWTGFVSRLAEEEKALKGRVFDKARADVWQKLKANTPVAEALKEAQEADSTRAKRLEQVVDAAAKAMDTKAKPEDVQKALLPITTAEADDDTDVIADILVKAGSTHKQKTVRDFIQEEIKSKKIKLSESAKADVAKWLSSEAMDKLTLAMELVDRSFETAASQENPSGLPLERLRQGILEVQGKLKATAVDTATKTSLEQKLTAVNAWVASRTGSGNAKAVVNAFGKELPDAYKLRLFKEAMRRGTDSDGPTVVDLRTLKVQLTDADRKAVDSGFQEVVAKAIWKELTQDAINWSTVQDTAGDDAAMGYGVAATAERLFETSNGQLTGETRTKFKEALAKALAAKESQPKEGEYAEYVTYLAWLGGLAENKAEDSAGTAYAMVKSSKANTVWTTPRKNRMAATLRTASLAKFKKPDWVTDACTTDGNTVAGWLALAWQWDTRTDATLPVWLALAHDAAGNAKDAQTIAVTWKGPLNALPLAMEQKVKFGLIRMAGVTGPEKDKIRAEIAWDAVEWLHVALNREAGNNKTLMKTVFDRLKKSLTQNLDLFEGSDLAVKAAKARIDILDETNTNYDSLRDVASEVLKEAAKTSNKTMRANYLAWAAMTDVDRLWFKATRTKEVWASLWANLKSAEEADPGNGEVMRARINAKYIAIVSNRTDVTDDIRKFAADSQTWNNDFGPQFRLDFLKDAKLACDKLQHRPDPMLWGMRADIGFQDWLISANTVPLEDVRFALLDAELSAKTTLEQKQFYQSKYRVLLGLIREDLAWVTMTKPLVAKAKFAEAIQDLDAGRTLADKENVKQNLRVKYEIDYGRCLYLASAFGATPETRKEAIRVLTAVTSNSSTVEQKNEKNEAYYYLGRALADERKYTEAIAAFDAVENTSIFFAVRDLYRGKAQLDRGDKLDDVDSKLKDKNSLASLYLRGRATRLNNRDEARSILASVMNKEITDPAVVLALAEYIQCRPTDALAAAKKCVEAIERHQWLILPKDRIAILNVASDVADGALKARITALEKRDAGY